MGRRSDLIDRGAFDRLLGLIGRIGVRPGGGAPAEIRPNNVELQRRTDEAAQEFQLRDGWDRRAWAELVDAARLSVNAARRWAPVDDDVPVPPLGRLPCPERPGGRCDDRYQVTGYVDVVDPFSGVSVRVPFTISSNDPLSRNQIGEMAISAAMGSAGWRGYDRTGMIGAGSATFADLTITSISGRGA